MTKKRKKRKSKRVHFSEISMAGTVRVGDTVINEGKMDTVVEILDTESFPYKTKSGLLFSRGGTRIVARPLGNALKDYEDSQK